VVGSLGRIISGSRKIVPANGGAAEIDKQLKTRQGRIWVGFFSLNFHLYNKVALAKQFFLGVVDTLNPSCDGENSTFMDYNLIQKTPKMGQKLHKMSQN